MEEKMDADIWQKIVNDLRNNPRDLITRPMTNRSGVWFYAEVIGKEISIGRARNHAYELSSKLSSDYFIGREEFERVYPIYLRRKAGEKVAKEAANATFKQVYIYAIIGDYEKNHRKGKEQNASENLTKLIGFFGLEFPIEQDKLKSAYYKLLSQYHPDKVSHLGREFKELSEQKTKEIIAKYETLQNWIKKNGMGTKNGYN
jgi:hypothetical protein